MGGEELAVTLQEHVHPGSLLTLQYHSTAATFPVQAPTYSAPLPMPTVQAPLHSVPPLPAPTAPSAPVVSRLPPNADGGFEAGQRIRHLPSGCKGTLVQWNQSTGRWKARMKDGSCKMVQSKYLQKVAPRLQVNGREMQQTLVPSQTCNKARGLKKKDEQARQCGQWLYVTGWLLLPFFGLGLLMWLLAACQYYSKSARTRKRYPQQSITACLSLVTLVMVVTTIVACIGLNLHPFQVLTSEVRNLTQEMKEGHAAFKDLLHEVGLLQKEAHMTMTLNEDHGGQPGISVALSTKPMPSSVDQFLGKPAHAASTYKLPGMAFK